MLLSETCSEQVRPTILPVDLVCFLVSYYLLLLQVALTTSGIAATWASERVSKWASDKLRSKCTILNSKVM